MAKNGEVCISILHEPGEDKYGYERPEERWLPIHTVETIMISVISMLADPNGDSPANVDAAVSSHSLEMLLVFVDARGSWGSSCLAVTREAVFWWGACPSAGSLTLARLTEGVARRSTRSFQEESGPLRQTESGGDV